jgi:hypothetical protein
VQFENYLAADDLGDLLLHVLARDHQVLQRVEAADAEVLELDDRQLREHCQHDRLQVAVVVDQHLGVLHEVFNHVVL